MALEQPHAGRSDEPHGPRRFVQALDRQPLADPVMEDDDVDIFQVLPRAEIARGEDETVLALEDIRFEVSAWHRLDGQELLALVRVPRSGTPLVADPELVEPPRTLANPGDFGDPA